MSELIQKNADRTNVRWKLLTSASALALSANICSANLAKAEDVSKPTVWIELGGQFDRFNGQGGPFVPPFVNSTDWAADGLESPTAVQSMHLYSIGGDGSISIEPSGTNWVFSASVRYGRTTGRKFLHQQKTLTTRFQLPNVFGSKYFTKTAPASYAQTSATKSESHTIVDFQAGKDVGLGMFGHDGTSQISAGVRFAQLSEKTQVAIYALPGIHFVPGTIFGSPFPTINSYPRYFATGHRASSFHGVGPTISWSASAPIIGNIPDGEVTFDWGANAAVLLGRQHVRTYHHTTGVYHSNSVKYHSTAVLPPGAGHRTESRSAVVPNLGGFAGVSFRYSNAKMSVGYRADFFFGALDNGFDARDTETRGFYGPYAAVSIGLGG